MIKLVLAALALVATVPLLGGGAWFWLDVREAKGSCKKAVEVRMSKEWGTTGVEWLDVDYHFGDERWVEGTFNVSDETEVGSEFMFSCFSTDGAVASLNVDVRNPG